MKKRLSTALAAFLFVSAFSFTSCGDASAELVLRVGSWDEYIDEGGADSFLEGSRPLYEEFEDWYETEYGTKIRVEYVALQDNETMYGKIKLGDSYDLLCPSEYMMMKLVAEGRLQTYPESFYKTSGEGSEHNYYAKYVSPYIDNGVDGIFNTGKTADGKSWREYIAGYMWGTTGFVINPNNVDPDDAKSWNFLKNSEYNNKITAKDNVRDAYFVGLGMYYEETLKALRAQSNDATYAEYLKTYMSGELSTSEETIKGVRKELEMMRSNLYGLETDEGKMDIIRGSFDASYQWSGDAVYVLDLAEELYELELQYVIPETTSNLWFDGWVMMKDIGEEKTQAAMAFVNFLSRPDNVVRNMYYIGYTSCISGDNNYNDVYEYVKETYGDEEGTATHDLNYFFQRDPSTSYALQTTLDQLSRQLFAQYPDEETKKRLVVMNYFPKEINETITRMWTNIK